MCAAICAVDREYATSAHGGYTQPTGIKSAAERTGTSAAGTGPPCLCSANRKNSQASAANHVGAAAVAAYHSDRAIGGKYVTPTHGGYTHPTRAATAAEQTDTSATGTGASRLCPANRKGDCGSTICDTERKYTTSAHERCTHSARSKAAAERTNVNAAGARSPCLCPTCKEIPRRKIICAGSSSYRAAGNQACGRYAAERIAADPRKARYTRKPWSGAIRSRTSKAIRCSSCKAAGHMDTTQRGDPVYARQGAACS